MLIQARLGIDVVVCSLLSSTRCIQRTAYTFLRGFRMVGGYTKEDLSRYAEQGTNVDMLKYQSDVLKFKPPAGFKVFILPRQSL